jgi:hypothetical protein
MTAAEAAELLERLDSNARMARTSDLAETAASFTHPQILAACSEISS